MLNDISRARPVIQAFQQNHPQERDSSVPNGYKTSLTEAENLQLRHQIDTIRDLQPVEADSGFFNTRFQAPTIAHTAETKPYSWFEARPDLIYYPNAWIQSLDDTPKKLFHKKQTKNLSLRKRIRKYINSKDQEMKLQPPKWDMNNVIDEIPPRDLLFLSAFDLIQENDTFRLLISGRADQNQVKGFFDPNGEESDFDINSDSDDEVDEMPDNDQSLQVWSTLLGTHPVDPASLDKLSREKAIKLAVETERKKFSKQYQQRLFNKLNDSVCVLRCYSMNLTQYFAYMYH